MSLDSLPAAASAPDLTKSSPPGVFTLFFAFAKMSLAGFGGVLAFARRGIVEQHHWMTADEFNETFALCHFLPGPNIVNLSVVFGSRFRGIIGGVAAFLGLVGPPMLLCIILAMLYSRYGEIEALRHVLAGVSCAAVGLLASVAYRMMKPLIQRRNVISLVVLVAVFIAVGLARLPLPVVLLIATPISIAITFFLQRRSKGT